MKKLIYIVVIAVAVITTGCHSTKVSKNTITWEEAVEISWEEFLKAYNYQDAPWDEQPDSVQNDYLDCWAGSAQEDSIFHSYNIVY